MFSTIPSNISAVNLTYILLVSWTRFFSTLFLQTEVEVRLSLFLQGLVNLINYTEENVSQLHWAVALNAQHSVVLIGCVGSLQSPLS